MSSHSRGPDAIRPKYFPALKRLVKLEGSTGQRRLWEALCATVLDRRRQGKKPLSVSIVDVAIPSNKLWWLSSDSSGLCVRCTKWDDFVTHLRRAARAVSQMLPHNALAEAVPLGVPQYEFAPLMLIYENGKKTLISLWDLRERSYDSRFSPDATILAILPTSEPYFVETEYRYDFLANKSEMYSRWLPVIEGTDIIPPIPRLTSAAKEQSFEIIQALETHWLCKILSAQLRFLLARDHEGELQMFCTGSCYSMELLLLSSNASVGKLGRFIDNESDNARSTRNAPCDGGFCHLRTRPVAKRDVSVEEIRWAHAEKNAPFVRAVAACGRLVIDENMPVEPVSDPAFWTRVNEQAPAVNCCPNCAAFYHRIRHNYDKACMQQQLDEVTNVIDTPSELRVERLHMGLSAADETMVTPCCPYIVAESTRGLQELAETLDVAERRKAISITAGHYAPSTKMTRRRSTAEFFEQHAVMNDKQKAFMTGPQMDDTFEKTASRGSDSSVNISPKAGLDRTDRRDTVQRDSYVDFLQHTMNGITPTSDGDSSAVTIRTRALHTDPAFACNVPARVLDDSEDSSVMSTCTPAVQVTGPTAPSHGDVDSSTPLEAPARGLSEPAGDSGDTSACATEAATHANGASGGKHGLDDAAGGDVCSRARSATSEACANAFIGNNVVVEESLHSRFVSKASVDRKCAAWDAFLRDDGGGKWADSRAMTRCCDHGQGVGFVTTNNSDSDLGPNVHINTAIATKPRNVDPFSPIDVTRQDELTSKDVSCFFPHTPSLNVTPVIVSRVLDVVKCDPRRETWEAADNAGSPDAKGTLRAAVATGETHSAVAAVSHAAVTVQEDGPTSHVPSSVQSATVDTPLKSSAKAGGESADVGVVSRPPPEAVSSKGGHGQGSQHLLLASTRSNHLGSSQSVPSIPAGSSQHENTSDVMLGTRSERDQFTATGLMRTPSRCSQLPAGNVNRTRTPRGSCLWETPVLKRVSMTTTRLLSPGNVRPSDTRRPQSTLCMTRAPKTFGDPSHINPVPSRSSMPAGEHRSARKRVIRLICLYGSSNVFNALVEYFRGYNICVQLSLHSNAPMIVVAKQPGDLLAAVKLNPACVILESAWPPRHPWTLCPMVCRGTGKVPPDLFKGATSKVVAASFARGPLTVARDVIVCLVLHTYMDT